MPRLFWLSILLTLPLLPSLDAGAAEGELRARRGLLALYDFAADKGEMIIDRAGVGEPLSLKIEDMKAVRRSKGALEIRGQARIRSTKPATRIIQVVRRSGAITVEAWIRPANTRQAGPARVVTISQDANQRNMTLGQDGDKFDARLRTRRTSTNGIPSVSTSRRSVKAKLSHVVYTRDRSGRARLYVDGKVAREQNVAGNLDNWSGSYRLALANEVSGGRPWMGFMHLVAIYGRALSAEEIARNHRAGASAETVSPAELAEQRKHRFFESTIAPLLAGHCIDCHDAAQKKGGLDLSRKVAAFAGGESGAVLAPGKSSESLLWEMVASDDMPVDRPPLSPEQKKQLKQWIDDGALWTLDVIDPAIYQHEGRASQLWVQRLTAEEYIETVRSAVGVDIRREAMEILPPDLRADGFSNTAYNLNVDLKHVDAYARLAEIIVSRMDAKAFARRFVRNRRFTDKDMGQLVSNMGKWLLRGPLEEHEVIAYRGISTTVASSGGSYDEAVGLIIQAMLQSPRFIYRIENQRGDGSTLLADPYELASRLSYIIWGGPPDETLLKAADSGTLDQAGVAAQVERMVKDPRTVLQSQRFIAEWLNLDRLRNLRPNPERFPTWNSQLAEDMREETLAYFREVAWEQKRPLSDLLNAQVTFATPRLAKHYSLPVSGDGLQRYDLKATPARGGLLTQGSVLTVGGDEASMVARGLFVLEDLLRGTVKDPPPCVDTTPIPTKAGRTQRAIAEARITNANCGGCHSKFEPLAFGLEKFDGVGAFHEKDEHGNRLRDDGQILFPGAPKARKYGSSKELMDLLAASPRVKECLTWKIAQFALGRPLVAADAPILAKIHDASQKNGGSYASVITALATSELVLMTRTEAE